MGQSSVYLFVPVDFLRVCDSILYQLPTNPMKNSLNPCCFLVFLKALLAMLVESVVREDQVRVSPYQ